MATQPLPAHFPCSCGASVPLKQHEVGMFNLCPACGRSFTMTRGFLEQLRRPSASGQGESWRHAGVTQASDGEISVQHESLAERIARETRRGPAAPAPAAAPPPTSAPWLVRDVDAEGDEAIDGYKSLGDLVREEGNAPNVGLNYRPSTPDDAPDPPAARLPWAQGDAVAGVPTAADIAAAAGHVVPAPARPAPAASAARRSPAAGGVSGAPEAPPIPRAQPPVPGSSVAPAAGVPAVRAEPAASESDFIGGVPRRAAKQNPDISDEALTAALREEGTVYTSNVLGDWKDTRLIALSEDVRHFGRRWGTIAAVVALLGLLLPEAELVGRAVNEAGVATFDYRWITACDWADTFNLSFLLGTVATALFVLLVAQKFLGLGRSIYLLLAGLGLFVLRPLHPFSFATYPFGSTAEIPLYDPATGFPDALIYPGVILFFAGLWVGVFFTRARFARVASTIGGLILIGLIATAVMRQDDLASALTGFSGVFTLALAGLVLWGFGATYRTDPTATAKVHWMYISLLFIAPIVGMARHASDGNGVEILKAFALQYAAPLLCAAALADLVLNLSLNREIRKQLQAQGKGGAWNSRDFQLLRLRYKLEVGEISSGRFEKLKKSIKKGTRRWL